MPAAMFFTTYAANKILDHVHGKTDLGALPTISLALSRCTAGSGTASPRSTVVTSGQVTVPATPNGHSYRCTTGGTTGAGEPTWGTTEGGTTSDGTAVWTEMTADWNAAGANVDAIEADYTGYARVTTAAADWNAAAAKAAANAAAMVWPACTAGSNLIFAVVAYDASTGGNGWWVMFLTSPVLVNTTYTPPRFDAGSNGPHSVT